MDRSRVAIVIPALNEAATIGDVVRAALNYGMPMVVDDGSHDPTANRAREAGALVISHPINAGYDAALNSGFARASELDYAYVVTMDADGQHAPGCLPRMIEALEQGADLVIGIRDRRQRFAEHLFAWVSQILWGIQDPLCGFKGYRIELYRELGYFDACQSIGTELAIFAARQRKHIKQMPITIDSRVDSPRFGRQLTANLKILKAMFKILVWSRVWSPVRSSN